MVDTSTKKAVKAKAKYRLRRINLSVKEKERVAVKKNPEAKFL